MKLFFLVMAISLCLPQICFSATCPNLTGVYWDGLGDKPQVGSLGRKTEIKQFGCEKIDIKVFWADAVNSVIFSSQDAFVWRLDGTGCTQTEVGGTTDCRIHGFDSQWIYTWDSFKFKSEAHGICKASGFSWARDPKGILEVNWSQCEDGFKGDITRILERLP